MKRSIPLRGGTTTQDPRLDRVVHFDERSRNFPIRTFLPTEALRNRRWKGGPVLDQGAEGACVGFGWTKELLVTPIAVRSLGNTWARGLYKQAQQLDPWPGEDYEGTAVIAGAKAVQQRGYMQQYRWAFGIDDVLATLSNFGPVVLGVNWHEGMYETRPSGLVEVSGDVVGGHCIVATGHHTGMRLWREGWFKRFHVVEWTNSWGTNYGNNGRGFIKVEDLAALLKNDGEACVPVTRKWGKQA